MKVFLSWSGEESKAIAEALKILLKDAIQLLEPWVSSQDIEAGLPWQQELSQQLNESTFAVICLTKRNVGAPWLNFEAGAISRASQDTHVCPYLFDLPPTDLGNEPLSSYQGCIADYDGTFKLLRTLNARLGEHALSAAYLQRTFDRAWPEFEDRVSAFRTSKHRREPNTIAGVREFFGQRARLSQDWWDDLYDSRKQPKEVFLMAQTLSRAFGNPKLAQTYHKWCQNGTRLRVLFLSPDNAELSQLHYVGKGMVRALSDDPTENLRLKIYKSLDDLDDAVISRINDDDKKPQVRFSTRDIPFSIAAVDDDMVVTFYGIQAEADGNPTLVISGSTSDAYVRFREEFEYIWRKESKVYPFENPLVSYFRREWITDLDRYVALRRYDLALPPPRQAIIFPTYRCDIKCSYCSFRRTRDQREPEEMDPGFFREIMEQLVAIGVSRVEISGGGEPLSHAKSESMLSALSEVRSAHPSVQLGLLTNGMFLGRHDPTAILSTFNEYVRVSRNELVEGTNRQELEAWRQNIRRLLVSKRSNKAATKIGLKYLLAPANLDQIVPLVMEDLADATLSDVDYFRFTSDRRVDPTVAAAIEQQIYYKFKAARVPNLRDRLALSLQRFTYARNHRCWISPISVVIAPDACVFMCCNYLHDASSKCLGDLKRQEFKRIWQSDHHLRLRRAITRDNCDRDQYCSCRFAEVQELFERTMLGLIE